MHEIRNGVITSVFVGIEDHGIFTMYLSIEGDGWGQSFGGWALDTYDRVRKKRVGTRFGIDFMLCLLQTLEVNTLEGLKGVSVRIDADHSKIHRLGHFLKDKWFDPAQLATQQEV